MILVAIDTNILAYAEGINGPAMKKEALDLLDRLPPESSLIPVQALAELFNVLVKKARRSTSRARAEATSWGDSFPLIDLSSSVMLSAMDLAVDHQLGIWDAVILASAADAGCRLLLSEDLQEGFTWSGVTVTNPFAASRHPLLDAMLTAQEA